MFKTLIEPIQKLRENGSAEVLLHPKVLANYRRYQHELADRPLVMHSQPTGVEIELTNRCNLACTQCLRSLGLKPYQLGNITVENFVRILDCFPTVMNLSLNGFGEPLMHPQFFEIVAIARKMRPWAKIGIYSNGQLITDEVADKLVHSGLTELNISIDAALPDTYRKVRRGGKLEPLHENIRRLVHARKASGAKRPMLGLNFVMLNENEGELVTFIQQAHDLGVDFVNCITWAGYDWGFRNQRSPQSYLDELAAARQRLDELGMRCKSFPEMNIDWTAQDKPFDCSFFWGEEFRVTHTGEVTLGCCTPFKEQYSYGNLLTQPFDQVWNNEKFQRNRLMARNGQSPDSLCTSCANYCKRFFASPEPGRSIRLEAVSKAG